MEGDSLRVEGTYVFLCREPAARTMVLLYPYPEDSLLGEASTCRLEARAPGQEWQPLKFDELPSAPGALWRVPLDLGDEVEVRTTYRQQLRSTHARYIVTTTGAWGRPLREAHFEIHLPPGAVPKWTSFPYRTTVDDGRTVLHFETENFAPVKDIVVEWESPPGNDDPAG